MGAPENKQLMQDVFTELSKGNSKPFLESLADDVQWTIVGTTSCDPERFKERKVCSPTS